MVSGRFGGLAAIAAGLVLLSAPPALEGVDGRSAPVGAVVRSWYVEDFHAELHVQRSGEVEVVETLRVRFEGSYNGIFRTIPIQYRNRANLNYTLRLEVLGVEDGGGQALRYETSRERHYRKIKVWVPGAMDAVRTVVIRYRVDNALRFFDEDDSAWDELYWNVTGDEWPVPIERASVRVRLPAAVTGVRARGFTGGYGSTDESAEVTISDYLVDVRATRELGIHEGLTVAIAWDSFIAGGARGGADEAGPTGRASEEYLIRRPTLLDRILAFLGSNWPLLLPVLAFFVMRHIWVLHGKDPRRLAIAPVYEPPEGLTPSEVGVLVDNRVDLRDVTAMLVDLAVRGYLIIEEVEKDRFLGLLKEKDYVLELRRGSEDFGGLKSHERKMLVAVFGSPVAGDRVHMSDLENEFYKDLPGIKDRIFDELMKLRYYRSRPDRVLGLWVAVAVGTGVVVAAGGSKLGATFGMAPLTMILAGAATAIVVLAFGVFMPARTIAGTRALEAALGFEEFLQRVESDRFKRMITGPEMFERYLPYAMCLGVEKKWAAAFEGMFDEPPDWYRGAGRPGFHPTTFVGDLSGMTQHAATAMTSAPRSSGGSGFSGGGGSGGGFGGGGGGAF
ncbi:MAG: DUF2207 domain-containing protein [Candidatus Palauibacterales bacterium]|nr:DUF2207 domain-containing protein [Candidatus Palauibacterales bacterium]